MTTMDPKEANPPSETPSGQPEPKRYDPEEEWESALLRAVQKINQKSRPKSPPHLRLVKRP